MPVCNISTGKETHFPRRRRQFVVLLFVTCDAPRSPVYFLAHPDAGTKRHMHIVRPATSLVAIPDENVDSISRESQRTVSHSTTEQPTPSLHLFYNGNIKFVDVYTRAAASLRIGCTCRALREERRARSHTRQMIISTIRNGVTHCEQYKRSSTSLESEEYT